MKQTIKILIALCAIMLLSVSAYADVGEKSQESILVQSLIEALSDSYVLPEEPDANVTRAEFVYTLMEALDLSGAECSFEDVPEKHFAYSAIAAAEDLKLTQQKSLFYPDRPITWQNAVEIAVSVLGYSEKADYYGGYPTGYLRVATELRLDTGMNGKQMNAENTLMLIFNTINSYPLEAKSVKNNAVSYKASDITLLYQYRKIAYAEGIVTADEASGLTNSKNSAAPGAISIDGVMYYGASSDGLLGKNCAVYYTEGMKNTILCVAPYSNNISKFEINSYDSIENSVLICNRNDGKQERLRLDGAYTVLYNRKATKSMNIASIVKASESGFVELTDNNADGKYDVVSITSYKYAWVSAIDLINGVIFDRISGQSLDLSDSELCLNIKVLSEGTLIQSDISEITPDTLIACAMSEDGEACSIVLCYDTIDTTVVEVGDFGGMPKAIANGNEYYINSFLYNFTKKPIGMTGVFCLGVNGEIVAVSGLAKELMYGCIMELKKDTFSKSAWILDENGTVNQINFASDLKLDGITYKTDDVWAELKNTFESDATQRVVRFKLKGGELAQIDTPDATSQIYDFNKSDDPDNSLVLYHSAESVFNAGAGFAPVFNIGGSTVNFVIPDKNSRGDISKYRVEPAGYFSDDTTYSISAYDIGRNSMAGATLVIENESNVGVSTGHASAVVARIEVATDEDDNQAKAITLWQSGTFTRYLASDECLGDIEKLEKGDIIRYAVSKGKIAYVTIDYDYSADTIASGVTKAGAKLEYFKGKLFSLDEGYGYIYTGDGKISTPVDFSQLRNAKINGVQTVLVETDASGRIEVKNMPSDVMRDYYSSGDDADNIVIRQYYYSSQLNVIYRKLN